MRQGQPSNTAYKVALNIVTLGMKPGMDEVLPPGIVDATEKRLIASGAASETLVRWSRSRTMVSIYEAFDWMLPGQFEGFGFRKAFCVRQVRDGTGADATQILVLGANAFLGSTGVNRHRSGRPCDVPVSRSCSEFVLSM